VKTENKLAKQLSMMMPEQVGAYKKEAMGRVRAGTMSATEAREFVDAFDELQEHWKAVRKSRRRVLRDGFIDPSRPDHAPYFEWLRDHNLLRVIDESPSTVH
jgi:hypothetical protein